MLYRKKLFKIHGWIGVKLSILFFIVCFSGTLATLSSEMDWLVTSAIRAGRQEELAGKNLMVRNLKAAFPESSLAYWLFDYARAEDSAWAHIPGLVIKQILPPGKHDRPIYLTDSLLL
jgi:uncharacterized iron-regulated membrane protein